MRFSANCGQAQRRCHNRKANEVPAVANIEAGLTVIASAPMMAISPPRGQGTVGILP
jgi:hypothetical protein